MNFLHYQDSFPAIGNVLKIEISSFHWLNLQVRCQQGITLLEQIQVPLPSQLENSGQEVTRVKKEKTQLVLYGEDRIHLAVQRVVFVQYIRQNRPSSLAIFFCIIPSNAPEQKLFCLFFSTGASRIMLLYSCIQKLIVDKNELVVCQ